MKKEGRPSHNILAQAGLITNESGRVFEPPCGNLDLPWLLNVSREARRSAREQFQQRRAIPDEVRFGWFVASTEAEFKGLKFLLGKDWRRALKAWKGGGLFNVHNRATLHRALYYSENSERPDAHIRECLRLYHHLSELAPSQRVYRHFQEELIGDLERSIVISHEKGDDESAARSLKVLSGTVGLTAVEHLQEKIFGQDLAKFRVACARVQKELLAYQGLAHAPPFDLLRNCEDELKNNLIPTGASFSHKLVEGSELRNQLEALLAQVCGILSQSYAKADDQRGAKQWLGEALRWEPSAVEDWRTLPEENFEEDDSADVAFPEKEQEVEESPTPRGSYFFGVQSNVVLREPGETREEWLESLFIAFTPVLPLKRFAAYRNLDTEEVGYYLRIPMSVMDHIRQGVFVLLLFFSLAAGVALYSNMTDRTDYVDPAVVAEKQKKVEGLVEQLKVVAQKESKLVDLDKLTPAQQKELDRLAKRRMELIKDLEKLEKDK